MPVLIDVTCLCDHDTDEALDDLHKAISDPPDNEAWAPHPNPLLRRIVDLFSERGLNRITGLQAELERWIKGDMYRVTQGRATVPGRIVAWTPTELAVVKIYLEGLPPEQFVLDDWMLLVDYLVHRYLSPDDTRTEAEWLASRSAIMGHVQAAMGAVEATPREADALLAGMATPEGARVTEAGLTHEQEAVLGYGRARCCELVTGLTDTARHRMRNLVMGWREAEYLGDRAKTAESLQTQLLDNFGTMNRDWRRIAVTEATNNAGNGLIASLPVGTRVRRFERYKGACPFCRSIDGRIFTVVDSADPDKDGEKNVWVGKSNVGRSASPKRREGDRLVDREPHEMWWTPAGTVHPHCQGGWTALADSKLPVDPAFSKWMDDVLGRSP